MTIESYILYFMACIAATITPGPAIILIVVNSLKYGVFPSLMTALGNISGLLVLCVISMFGIKYLLLDIPFFFETIKILGAAYLFYLGAKSWVRAKGATSNAMGVDTCDGISMRKNLYKEAFLVAVSNPKALVFVFALFPQFVNIEETHFIQFVILTGILMSFLFLFLYAYFAGKIRVKLMDGDSLERIYKISGIIFMLVAVVVAISDL